MTESFEFENVRIGNWQGRLPSQVCTDRNIFNEIFSQETWDKVLLPDQKDRILKMLPPEVLSTPGAAEQTIEDLLAKTLTRFETNPLENLFNQLEVGQYDPDVVVTKAAIRKEWRKESLRKRKKYHTKLLEEIVVSRDKHLRTFDSTSNNFLLSNSSNNCKQPSKVEKLNNNFTPFLESDSLFVNNVKDASMYGKNSISNPADDNIYSNHITKRVNKRVKEELSTINRKLGCLSSSEDESPVIKKPSTSKVTTKTSKSSTTTKSKATKCESPKAAIPAALSNSLAATSNSLSSTKIVHSKGATSPPSTLAHPTSCSTSLKPISKLSPTPTHSVSVSSKPVSSREEQTAATMAKFPKILPAPISNSVISATSLSSTSTITSQNHMPPSSSVVQMQSSITSPSPLLTSNPVKSSPILASQLQAPAMTMGTYSAQNSLNKMPSPAAKLPASIMSFSCQNKLSDKSSEDDLESSSDEFEFETLNPSIVFSTNNFPSMSTKSSINTFKKGIPGSNSRQLSKTNSLTPTLNTKPKISVGTPVTPFSTANKVTVSSVSSITMINKSIPSTAIVLQSHQQVSNKTKGAGFNSSMLTKDSTHLTSPSHSTSSSNSMPKMSTNLLPPVINPAAATSKTVLPLVMGIQCSPSQNQQNKILLSSNSGSVVSIKDSISMPPRIDNTLSTTNSNSTNISPMASDMALSSLNLNLLSGNEITSGALHQTVSEQIHNNQNSSSIVDTDDLNLNSLGLGLGMGINMNLNSLDVGDDINDVDGDNSKLVMENIDKMDDLSVLDGNPFDSIPNLSDELDGLDLDMVDGLCDFDGLLSEEKQYASFFSLIRDVLCSTRDHRMTLVCLEKTIRKWAVSPSAALNLWFMKVTDWNEALITALNFLAGNYQDVHPEEFVPYIEYKYKTKYYQWIGAGRDGDNNLTPLCTLWMDNLERLPPLKKLEGENDDPDDDDDEDNDSEGGPNEDMKKKNKRPLTPPPPRCVTDWAVRPSTQEEKEDFQVQERGRFDNPHKAFTYRMHGYESVVGPVKGVYSSQSGMTNKARGHSLLVDDRPPYVTILALVRDAVARLPNGEGTRSEICEMLRDSAFLAAEASNVTLNSVVSGALDRLHYERDPCVRYDSHKKSWIYLHRDRTQEQFERLHHNRSYTKSTKSRNNTSRKSRKAAIKSPAQTSNSPNDTSGTVGGSNITSGTPLPKVGTLIGTSSVPTATSTPISTTRNKTISGKLVTTQSMSTSHTVQSNTLTLTGTTTIPTAGTVTDGSANLTPQTIRFTIPGTSNVATIGGHFSTSHNSVGNEQQHLLLQTNTNQTGPRGGIAITSQQNQVPLQIQTQASLQVQNLNNAGNANNTTVNVNNTGGSNLITVSTAPQTATSGSFAPGQLVFSSQALLRLAGSLRLPEGVRFTQLRVPQGTVPNVGNAPLRLPQHRILLTRGGLPGSTQGVLLQTVTSTGQTVLLSTTPGALSNLQGASTAQLTPISLQANSSTGDALAANNPQTQTAQNINIMNTSNQNVNVVTTSSLTSLSGSTVTVSQGLNSTQLGLDSSTGVGGTISLPASMLTSNTNAVANHQSIVSQGSSSNQTLMTTTGTTMQSLTMAQTQSMVSQVQALQAQNSAGQTAQLTSPIIIRSNQGDFVIPGHISLGRGMQGIKVIPMPTGGGKQTVIARIVTPTTLSNPAPNTQS